MIIVHNDNKRHAFREVLSFLKNLIVKEKCAFTKRKSKKCDRKTKLRKFDKYNIGQLYFGSLVLALQCYCEHNRLKIRISFKTLVSKNATTWWSKEQSE